MWGEALDKDGYQANRNLGGARGVTQAPKTDKPVTRPPWCPPRTTTQLEQAWPWCSGATRTGCRSRTVDEAALSRGRVAQRSRGGRAAGGWGWGRRCRQPQAACRARVDGGTAARASRSLYSVLFDRAVDIEAVERAGQRDRSWAVDSENLHARRQGSLPLALASRMAPTTARTAQKPGCRPALGLATGCRRVEGRALFVHVAVSVIELPSRSCQSRPR